MKSLHEQIRAENSIFFETGNGSVGVSNLKLIAILILWFPRVQKLEQRRHKERTYTRSRIEGWKDCSYGKRIIFTGSSKIILHFLEKGFWIKFQITYCNHRPVLTDFSLQGRKMTCVNHVASTLKRIYQDTLAQGSTLWKLKVVLYLQHYPCALCL